MVGEYVLLGDQDMDRKIKSELEKAMPVCCHCHRMAKVTEMPETERCLMDKNPETRTQREAIATGAVTFAVPWGLPFSISKGFLVSHLQGVSWGKNLKNAALQALVIENCHPG